MHHRFDIPRTDPRAIDARRDGRRRRVRLPLSIAAEDSVHDNFTGLLDGKELVLSVVRLAESRRRNALVTHVVVGAVEALVAHTNDLGVTHVADDVPVDGQFVCLGLSGATCAAGRLNPALTVLVADPVELRVLSRCVHGEEPVRKVVVLALGWVGYARRAEVEVYKTVNTTSRAGCIKPTVAIQALVPYTDNRIQLTPVAVDARVGQGSRRNDFWLLRFLAGPVVRLLLPRRLNREENVGYIMVPACIGTRHTHVAQIIVYRRPRSAYPYET